eukprot:16158490-Heterocapsa_arctica.AAC.1
MRRIPQSDIVARIKLSEGEYANIGVDLDQEGSLFPWGMHTGLNTTLVESTRWRQLLMDNNFISISTNLHDLQYSWEVPTIEGHTAFYAS